MLLLIYINFGINQVNVPIEVFAGDRTIYSKVKTLEDQVKLNIALPKICEWSETWQINLNYFKTVAMAIT